MQVNNENYYLKEVRSRYMSASTLKGIIGTIAMDGCEAKTYAELNGWIPEFEKPKTALLVGAYVDSYFEGTIDNFTENHPEIFSTRGATKGQLKSEFQHALKIIQYIERDKVFMMALNGEKQKILRGEIFGIEFIGKADYLHDEAITDLKIMKDMKPQYVKEIGWVNFVIAWGYDLQLAIYQELEYQMTGKRKECFIACATKEKPPRKAVIEIPQDILDDAMYRFKMMSEQVRNFQTNTKHHSCENCDYCLETQNVSRIVNLNEL